MARSGLSKRLQQQSRRSGFAVGISMLLAVAVCFAAFTWIYVQLEPWVQDFAGAEEAPATATARPSARDDEDGEEEGEEAEESPPTRTPVPEDDGADEEPIEETDRSDDEEDDDQFEPDFVVSAGTEVNFRSEPSTAAGGATIIVVIPNGTELEATGQTAEADDPDNGPWRQFRLEDGTEGWLREVDVSES